MRIRPCGGWRSIHESEVTVSADCYMIWKMRVFWNTDASDENGMISAGNQVSRA